jgi:riboflavin kinase/FMN adenylyltransferase
VAIGNFDGVHLGHREVLDEARRRCPDLPLIVVTFWPHPRAVLTPGGGPMLLTRLEERIELLQAAGADRVEVIRFTPELASWSPERFVADILLPLNPRLVVVGENFRFGNRAAGTVQTLRDLGEGQFDVLALGLVTYGENETCSSLIRQALLDGEVEHAAEHLGRSFRFAGVVTVGDRRGRGLGFPTANLPVPKNMACPADGVYAGWLTRLDGRDGVGDPLPEGAPDAVWPAAISVGTNPTFDGEQRRVESYCLDRDDLALYGVPIAVDFVARIRGQVKFGSIEALIEQMDRDVADVRGRLGIARQSRISSDLR